MAPRDAPGPPYDLVLAIAWACAGVWTSVEGAPEWIRIPLGLGLVFVVPGYALFSLLFPTRLTEATADKPRRGLRLGERLAFSVGSSIALVVVVGFSLHLGKAPLDAGHFIGWLGGVAIVLAVGGLVRRALLPPEQAFRVGGRASGPAYPKVLVGLLVGSFLLIAAAVTLVVAFPRE